MGLVSLLTYATFMDPRIAMQYNLLGPNLVWANGWQRFFGMKDATSDINTVFKTGEIPHIAMPVVIPSENYRFNGVIYRGIDEAVLNYIDAFEKGSNLFSAEVDPALVTLFGDNTPWQSGGSGLFMYTTKPDFLTENINPSIAALYNSREAARVHGDEFRRAYEETTFLADRITKLEGCGF